MKVTPTWRSRLSAPGTETEARRSRTEEKRGQPVSAFRSTRQTQGRLALAGSLECGPVSHPIVPPYRIKLQVTRSAFSRY